MTFPDASPNIVFILAILAILVGILAWKWPDKRKAGKRKDRVMLNRNSWRSKNRLKALCPNINEAIEILEELGLTPFGGDGKDSGFEYGVKDPKVHPKFWRIVTNIKHHLNGLGVKCPVARPDGFIHKRELSSQWHRFLLDLSPLAETGNLKEARALNIEAPPDAEEGDSKSIKYTVSLGKRAVGTTSPPSLITRIKQSFCKWWK